MDRVSKYKSYIRTLLEKYGDFKPSYGDVEVQLIFDQEHNHYQIMSVGWKGQQRVRGCLLHIDIKDGKIWIQHDGTEIGIANEFLALGVPKEDIVLAFHAPARRVYTDFAIG